MSIFVVNLLFVSIVLTRIVGVSFFENGCGPRVTSQFSWSAKYGSWNFDKIFTAADRAYKDNQKIRKNHILKMDH